MAIIFDFDGRFDPQRDGDFPALASRVWREMVRDDIFNRAAILGFYFMLALFPLLLCLAALLGLFAQAGTELRDSLFSYLSRVAPRSAYALIYETDNEVAVGGSHGKLTVGLLASVWAASNGMLAVVDTLNMAYRVREARPWWKARLVAAALTLAEACRLGAYRPAHRTSDRQRHVRAHLAVREAMVRTRSRYISLISTLLRRDGLRVAPGRATAFLKRLACVGLSPALSEEVAPLVLLLQSLNNQIKAADEQLAALVKEDEVVGRLCTAPGVGPVTAASFVSTLDEAARFAGPKQARAYLGLVPSERSSGERHQRGHISKAGPGRARSMLIEAAWTILRRKSMLNSALHEWAAGIAARRGSRVAVVALARKLAGILYAMWRDGTKFGGRAGQMEAGNPAAAAA